MNKIHFSLALLLALVTAASAQTPTSRYRLALTVAPNIAYIHTGISLGKQHARPGFHTRIDGELRLAGPVWIRVGAGYSVLRYKSELNNLQWPNQNNGNGGFDPSVEGEKVYLVREDNMLTFPVGIRFYGGKKQRAYLDLESGGSLILVQNGSDVFKPSLGMAVGYQFFTANGRTSFFAQPAFRYVINNSFSGDLKDYNQHPYSFGLEMGVRMGLGG